jgi:Tfp pilus assembly protein PilX
MYSAFKLLPRKEELRSQSGQVAVVVFLIMAVLLVIGLSLSRRTSQEIELAGQQQDTTRVFNAAESGVEAALSNSSYFKDTSQTVSVPDTNSAKVTTTVNPNTGVTTRSLAKGESSTIFVRNGTVELLWGTSTSCTGQAALLVSVYYRDGSDAKVQYHGFRPDDKPSECTHLSATGFTKSVEIETVDTVSRWKVTFTAPAGAEFITVKPLFADTVLVAKGAAVTEQSHTITSTATDNLSTETKEVRTVEVVRSKPAPPGIFDYAVYSGGDLKKP